MEQEIFWRKHGGQDVLVPHVFCEEPGCRTPVAWSWCKRGNVPRCAPHRKKQLVAGRPTKSKQVLRDADIITHWGPVPGKKMMRPMTRCSVPNCGAEVVWKAGWSDSHKKNRKCVPCTIKYGRLRPWEGLYHSLLSSAGQSEREVTISYEEFALLCSVEECRYCAAPLKRRKLNKGQRSVAYYLDRKDDLLPYSYDNVVSCCTPCNFTKAAWLNYEEMLVVGAMRAGNAERASRLARVGAPASREHSAVVAKRTHLRLTRRAKPKPDLVEAALAGAVLPTDGQIDPRRVPAQQTESPENHA